MAARKLTGNSGKAIFSPAQRVPLSTLDLPETFRLGSSPGRLSSGSFPGARGQRSLLNTFPFNQKELDHPQEEVQDKGIIRQDDEVVEKVNEDEAKHQEDRQVHGSSLGLASRDSRQGGEDLEVGFAAVAAASPDGDGKRCIDKVQMVEETVYDEVMQCDHSYDRRCHTTYTTSYESQQEEECEENFRKTCFIEYEKTARNETVNVCREPLVNTCEGSVEVCKTVYESECWTKQEAHEVEDDVVECTTELETKCQDETSGYTTNTKCSEWPKEVCTVSKKPVTKYTPITGCTKEPREICGLSDSCTLVPGETECYDKTQTIMSDAPKEQCSLEPQRTCSHVTKLVPKLEPKEECTDVPKEVCTRSRTNPRKVKKPVVKKWCYIPTEESGLFNLHNVRKTIGDPVTEAEKDAMIEDLKAAEREFVKREVESKKAAHILPFVTVNKKTTLVATHSRLVQAFELAVVNSVQRLNISVAYEEVR